MSYDTSKPLGEKVDDVQRYLQDNYQDELDWIVQTMREHRLPEIQITPNQGRLLRTFAQAINAARIVEIGTLAGYSAVWLSQGLVDNGQLVTIEMNPKHAALARQVFERAGVAHCMDLRLGSARDVLKTLDAPFDLAFFDADKRENQAYLTWAIDEGNVRSGGMVVIDNVIRDGLVLDPPTKDTKATSVAQFNQFAFAKYANHSTVVPFMKGTMLDAMMVIMVP